MERKFEYDGKEYFIADPTAEDIKEADWIYSKVYTKSLMDNIMTSSELMDVLTRRGIIGPEYEQRRNELEEQLSEKIMELSMAKDIEEKRQLALEVAKLREELFRWMQRLNGPLSNTCEQLAEDARTEYLASRLVTDKEGNRIWGTYEDFLQEKDQGLALMARFQVMLYLQGLEPDTLENMPEELALREIEQQLQEEVSKAVTDMEADLDENEKDKAKEAAGSVEKETKAKKKKTKKTTKKK